MSVDDWTSWWAHLVVPVAGGGHPVGITKVLRRQQRGGGAGHARRGLASRPQPRP
jgi:hypothetical protein